MARLLSSTLVSLLLFSGTTLAADIVRGDLLVLENERIRLAFDRGDGRLLAVDNLVQGLSLLPEGGEPAGLPEVTFFGARPPEVQEFGYVVVEDEDQQKILELSWDYADDVSLVMRAELAGESELCYLWPRVENAGSRKLNALHFPRLPRLATLGESAEDDILVSAFVRGTKVRDPARSLDIPHNPMLSARYPQAYNGLTHQLIDYYSEGIGGFFFACFDPHSTEKTIELPLADGGMGMEWRFHGWDQRAGASLDFDFAFVFGVNTTGDWYRAADHYREWALTTDWVRRAGPNSQRREDGRAPWLFEDIGLATFGTAASVDQSAWYQAYHDLAGATVFHVTGVESLGEQGRGGDPFDIEFRVHPSNRAAFDRNGDRFAIFLADLKTTFLPVEMAREVGRTTISVVARATPEACPGSDLWRQLHASRAARALELTGADSFYHDASAPNRSLLCESLEHGHPPGRGRWMNERYREQYQNSQAAVSEICGDYTPIGVELMHEGLIDSFDYYQARNGAGFMGGLEGGFYRGLQLRGKAETVPVFAYIYHDYAPVALDGCGKVSERIGDIFYWMSARVALAGGIFELNNEFSPTERFPGMKEVGIVHYRKDRPFEWVGSDAAANSPYDPLKGAFVRELVAARTDFAQDFLAYGQMLPPLEVEAGEVELGFAYYNNIDWGGRPNSLVFSEETGKYRSPRVLHSAWKFADRLGLLFVNLDAEEVGAVVSFDLERYRSYGLRLEGKVMGERVTSTGRKPFRVEAGIGRELSLPSRQVVLLEFQVLPN